METFDALLPGPERGRLTLKVPWLLQSKGGARLRSCTAEINGRLQKTYMKARQ